VLFGAGQVCFVETICEVRPCGLANVGKLPELETEVEQPFFAHRIGIAVNTNVDLHCAPLSVVDEVHLLCDVAHCRLRVRKEIKPEGVHTVNLFIENKKPDQLTES